MLISEKMKKGFTITELMVAVAILAITMAGVSTIFKISITAYRTSSATAEVMRNLRAITDQLDADFKSIRKDALLAIRFKNDANDFSRHDQITFFANGDFQSVRQYQYDVVDPSKVKTVVGNVARLYYGQAQDLITLARRQRILTADTSLPATNLSGLDEYEHPSLADWRNVLATNYAVLIPLFFGPRLVITTENPDTLHMLMSQAATDLAVQFEDWDSDEARWLWYPSIDPDGDGDLTDSHFAAIGKDSFGCFFNVSDASDFDDWYLRAELPKTLKFTFTLYDSRGVLEKGMTFTHIVYIED